MDSFKSTKNYIYWGRYDWGFFERMLILLTSHNSWRGKSKSNIVLNWVIEATDKECV